jgi:probable F420-dependent oxidoreductase
MTRHAREYGVLLPHFGTYASRARILDSARAIERYGFDSVWVRDHIVYHPHEHEDQDRTHVDPFVVLSAIAATTDRITLATGTLIPHRHPILAALMLGSLDFMAGPGRVLAGWGLGTYDHEFEAIERADWDRRRLIGEQIAIVRQLWTGDPVTFHGEFYNFEDVDIHPVPGDSHAIPIWYGGMSLASARRAVEYCDGWIPGRMPIRDFRKRVARMEKLAAEAGKPVPTTGTIPYIVPARTVEEGIKFVDMPRLIDEFTRLYELPAAGAFRTLADADGAVVAGPPEVLVEAVRQYQEAGVQHYVFDLRLRYADFEDCLALIGEEVLPVLHRGDGRVGGSPAGPGRR